MKQYRFLIVALGMTLLSAGMVEGSQTVNPGFDVNDLFSASRSDGAITPKGFDIIKIALKELEQYGVAFEKYQSVHVWQTENYYYVVFSPNELGSTVHGRLPNTQLGIEVQIAKETMRITGSRAE